MRFFGLSKNYRDLDTDTLLVMNRTKKRFYCGYYLLLLGMIAFSSAHAQFNCKVEGIVTHDETVLSGAIVSLHSSVGKEKEVLTNAEGEFSFSLKPNEEYNIFVTKQGFTKIEIIYSTMGFSDDDGKKFKGVTNLKIELFKLPPDEDAVFKINEILSTPIMSYYYDSDKNVFISDESLEESLKEGLVKIQNLVEEGNKKVDPAVALENEYKKEILNANKLFEARKYELAKTSYSKASALKPNETYPKARLSEVEKMISNAKERERLAKEKAEITDNAEKERIAKEKAAADALAEKDRIAREQEIATNKEKERIAKEKAMAENAEKERLAKEKELLDAAERERLAKEKAIADAAEKERLAKEEEKRIINKKYILAITTADSAYVAKSYTIAKTAYNKALEIKPTESYPKGRIEQIDLEIAKSGDFKNELAQKYPEGITEEIIKEGNATVTRRIVVIGNKGYLYIMRHTSFGTYYFKDDAPISEAEFKKNTEGK